MNLDFAQNQLLCFLIFFALTEKSVESRFFSIGGFYGKFFVAFDD